MDGRSVRGDTDTGRRLPRGVVLSDRTIRPITLYHAMPIGQISFMRMDGPVENPYGSRACGSKYQGQTEPTATRFHLNFERPAGEGAGPR